MPFGVTEKKKDEYLFRIESTNNHKYSSVRFILFCSAALLLLTLTFGMWYLLVYSFI